MNFQLIRDPYHPLVDFPLLSSHLCLTAARSPSPAPATALCGLRVGEILQGSKPILSVKDGTLGLGTPPHSLHSPTMTHESPTLPTVSPNVTVSVAQGSLVSDTECL